MAGLLLTTGPIATRVSVNGLSRAFRFIVTSSKFEAAANKLHNSNLGTFVTIKGVGLCQWGVFIKKPPSEAAALLQLEANAGLCIPPEEYELRYKMPAAASITRKMKDTLVDMGLVQRNSFAEEEEDAS